MATLTGIPPRVQNADVTAQEIFERTKLREVQLGALEGLFQQVLRMALELGAMKLGRIAIDGSKLKANASKHKAMSYKRLKEQELRLREETRRLLQQAEAIDEAEDAEYGRDGGSERSPDSSPELSNKLSLLRLAIVSDLLPQGRVTNGPTQSLGRWPIDVPSANLIAAIPPDGLYPNCLLIRRFYDSNRIVSRLPVTRAQIHEAPVKLRMRRHDTVVVTYVGPATRYDGA